MTHTLSVAALVLGLAAFGVLAPATAKPAAACSFAQVTLEEMAEQAEIVIVGEVVSEQRLGPDVYRSTVSVSTTLKGHPEREFTLDQLGFLLGDCTGGPRLAGGERVLLFLTNWGGRLQVDAYEQGKYVLSEGEAKTLSNPAMSAEDALRRVAAVTGAAPGQVDAALAFAKGESLDNDDHTPLLIGLAAGVLVLLTALPFGIQRLRRES